jgi:hypothetical protein
VFNGQHAKHFQWKHGISLDAGGTLMGCATPSRGGSDDHIISYALSCLIGCHGNLQSAGNASWTLYGRARLSLRAALLYATRSTSSSIRTVRSPLPEVARFIPVAHQAARTRGLFYCSQLSKSSPTLQVSQGRDIWHQGIEPCRRGGRFQAQATFTAPDGASPPLSVTRLALANIPTAHCEWMMLALVGSRNNSIFFPLLSVT